MKNLEKKKFKIQWNLLVQWLLVGAYVVHPVFAPTHFASIGKVTYLICSLLTMAGSMHLAYLHGRRDANVDALDQVNSYRAWTKVTVKERTGVDLDM